MSKTTKVKTPKVKVAKKAKVPKAKVPKAKATKKENVFYNKEGLISFRPYIHDIREQVHPDHKLTKNTVNTINRVLNLLGAKIAKSALTIALSQKKKTISSHDVSYGIRVSLPKELAKHANSEMTKACTKFQTTSSADIKPTPLKSKPIGSLNARRAGILISPSRARQFFRSFDMRISSSTPVALAAVLDYIAADLLEVAGQNAISSKRVIISNQDVFRAVDMDVDLTCMFSRLNIAFGSKYHVNKEVNKADRKKALYLHNGFAKNDKEKLKGGMTLTHKGKARPGIKALKDVINQQASNNPIIPKAPLSRLVREIAQESANPDIRFTGESINQIREYIEGYMGQVLSSADLLRRHAKRKTLKPVDLQLAIRKCVKTSC